MSVTGTKRKEYLVLEERPGRLSPEQIRVARDKMSSIKFHPREALPNKTALQRAEALYVELTGPVREDLGHDLAAFRAALETQDAETIKDWRERLLSFVLSYQR